MLAAEWGRRACPWADSVGCGCALWQRRYVRRAGWWPGGVLSCCAARHGRRLVESHVRLPARACAAQDRGLAASYRRRVGLTASTSRCAPGLCPVALGARRAGSSPAARGHVAPLAMGGVFTELHIQVAGAPTPLKTVVWRRLVGARRAYGQCRSVNTRAVPGGVRHTPRGASGPARGE